MVGNNTTNSTDHHLPEHYRIALLCLYSFVFFGGTLNVVLMSCMLQSQKRLSYTKVFVINLIAVHFVFLVTVPFRIYHYASDGWSLGFYFCKIVSVMIHGHMYLAFIFYVFILIVRHLELNQQHRLEFHRIFHATIASVTVWFVILGSVLPPTLVQYGTMQSSSTRCFRFGKALEKPGVKTLNYVICIMVLVIWSVLVFFQMYLLLKVRKKFGKSTPHRQEFWAQMKNVVFLMVMFFCFVPYQGFRIYYTSEYSKDSELENKNEIFLAITAFSCFDMIVFAGRDVRKHISSKGHLCCL